MNVLIIKLSPIDALSSSTLRAIALAKSFLNVNWDVDFVTTPTNELSVMNQNVDLEGINIIKTNSNPIYSKLIRNSNKSTLKNIALKPLRYTYHKFSVFNNTKNIAKNLDIKILPNNYYDILITVSDPKTSHIAGQNLISQGLKTKEWVQYWGDPLVLDITNKTLIPKKLIYNIEKNLLSRATKVFYASPITLKEQIALFDQLSKKMYYIPTPYIQQKKFNKNSNELFTVSYIGAYNSKVRNAKPLYNTFLNLEQEYLYIVGNSDLSLKSTNNISVFPRQEATNIENKTDLLVVILNSRGTQIPGKIFHYAATNKPILVLLDGDYSGEIQEFFKKYNRYYFCENEEAAISEKILEIKNTRKDFSPLEEFSYVKIAPKIISKLNHIDSK